MSRTLVTFDGECALCNGTVAWLVRRDRRRAFLLAGSAGDIGREAVRRAGLPSEVTRSTIVVARAGHVWLRSDAVLAIADTLGWPWRAAAVLRVVPRALRDRVYGWVANRRPPMEAGDPSCGVPPPRLAAEWRARLATRADLDEVLSPRT